MSLLTVRAAAERMGIGYSTLKQWIFQGKIRTTRRPAAITACPRRRLTACSRGRRRPPGVGRERARGRRE